VKLVRVQVWWFGDRGGGRCNGIQESSGVGEKMFRCVSTTIVPLALHPANSISLNLKIFNTRVRGVAALTARFFVEVILNQPYLMDI
jgi:hypothetical protein